MSADNILGAIRLLLGTLPEPEQRRIVHTLAQEITPIVAPRAGAVLATIIDWMPRNAAWTVGEAKRAVAERGIPAPDKEIYNAIGYLTRRRRVTRIAYGHYEAPP